MPVDPDKKRGTELPPDARRLPSSKEPAASSKPPDRSWKPVIVSNDDWLRRMPGVLDTGDITALHACWSGTADAQTQRRALLAIHKIASTGDMSYRPNDLGGERDSVFAEGKRYVGLQMQKLIDHHSHYVQDANKT